MPVDSILPTGMTIGLIAWSLVFRWYVHPALSGRSLELAVRPLLLLHAFRYVGLMFLVPGVTSEPLDPRFADPAAYGDLVAALLALTALAAFRLRAGLGIVATWFFNVWGLIDLLNAVGRGLLYTADGHLGATYWIPATVVPLLIVSHMYIFWLLIRIKVGSEDGRTAARRA